MMMAQTAKPATRFAASQRASQGNRRDPLRLDMLLIEQTPPRPCFREIPAKSPYRAAAMLVMRALRV